MSRSGASKEPWQNRHLEKEDLVFANGITLLDGMETIKREQAADDFTAGIIQSLKEGKPLAAELERGNKFLIVDDVLCRQSTKHSDSRVQIVAPKALRWFIFDQLHVKSGHLGVYKTFEKVRERFYWPGYEDDIREAVEKCDACQRRKQPVPQPRAPLGTINSSYPFQKVSWDMMGPLPTTLKGNKYILVVTDLFTKWVEAFPLSKTDSTTLATVLTDNIVCRFGVPETIHSDQGSNFVSNVIQALCDQLGINRTQTTAYHPQGNGQVERFNRTLEGMLSKVISDHQRDWDDHLQKALFAYRTAIHESTGFTPFMVTFGRSPNLPIDIILGSPRAEVQQLPEYVQKTQTSLKAFFTEVRNQIKAAHLKQKREADKKVNGEMLHVGDRVWLFVPTVKQRQTRKFSSFWRGPYTIIDKVSAVNFKIQLIGGQQKQVVHRNRLKLCRTDPAGTDQQHPLSPSEGNTDIVSTGMDPDQYEQNGREDPDSEQGGQETN